MSEDYNNPSHMTAPQMTGSYIAEQYHRTPKNTNTRELVDKWFIKPLERMNDHDGFICLMCLFPLYEKHLRHKHKLDSTENFTAGNKVFKTIGSHLGISKDEAYQFWQHFRNGLLHSATPKVSSDFRWVIRRDGQAIERDTSRGNHVFMVNPFAIRDRLLKEIEPDIAMWKQDDIPLSVEFQE